MKQAKLIKPECIHFEDVEMPAQLAPNEVLLKIYQIGICGSDIHAYHGKHPATFYPVVQGHEYSGVITAIGSEVTKAIVGQKATARPQLVCGQCAPCKRGQYNTCQELRVQGFQADGVAQDYFVTTEDRLIPLADTLSFEFGAMVEPAAVGAHSTRRCSDLMGKNVVVSGAGTIGNLVAQFAKVRGAKKVLITDVSSFKLEKARECGIEHLLNVSSEDFSAGLKKAFGSEGYQVGFEAAGVQSSLDALIANVEKGGEVVVLGVYAQNPVVNMFYVGEHELNIYGSMMYKHEDYQEAASFVADGKICLKPLVSKHFPFEKYSDAYQYIADSNDKVMKVIIDVNE